MAAAARAGLPLAIPEPVAKGAAGRGLPFAWSVYRWIEGEAATRERLADPEQAARATWRSSSPRSSGSTDRRPDPDAHNSFRGVPLATRDAPRAPRSPR